MLQPLLQVHSVSKFFTNKNKRVKTALDRVSIELYPGEVFGLLGVNGAGKSTLASIIASLHPPSSGEVLWKGVSIYEQLLTFRKMLGFCPQKPNLDKELSLEEMLLFSARCYGMDRAKADKRKDELLEKMSLEKYRTAIVDELSGGYRQRFLIARALMHEPELLILDEPTVGLDPHFRRELWQILRSLKEQQITILLTTHYLDEAEVLSDRVCLLHEGSIRAIDSPENLRKLHKKNSLEEVFLKFVDDPDSELFNSVSIHE